MNALIVSPDTETRAVIQRLCARRNPPVVVTKEVPPMPGGEGGVAIAVPGLIFFDARGDASVALNSLERLATRYPNALILMLAPTHSPDLLIAAMRLGVREVVGVPINLLELEQAIDRISDRMRSVSREEGKVLSVVSSKGGSGATFVATNLAYALATVGQKRTLLIDLNLQFGDAAIFLSDARPSMTMSDLCAEIVRLDEQLLESSLLNIEPNLGVLAASPSPDPDDSIRPDHVAAILSLAKKHYDFILLDVGRQVNAVTIRALDGSDLIMPVLQQSLPFIRNGQRMLEMYSTLGYRRENIRQILNRHDDDNPITVADMERGIGHRIAFQIPNNFEIASASINQGEPVLRLARSSNLSKGLIEIVRALTDTPVPSAKSIIRRLFVRNAAMTD